MACLFSRMQAAEASGCQSIASPLCTMFVDFADGASGSGTKVEGVGA